MYISNSMFKNNYGNRGGVIVLSQSSYFYSKANKFEKNISTFSGGVIFVNTESYFEIYSTTFLSNESYDQNSVIEVLGSSKTNDLLIHQSSFERNSAEENTIQFMYALAEITECYFTRNTANSRSKNVFMGFSTVVVDKSTFRSSPKRNPEEYVLEDATQGAFMFIIIDVELNITTSNFLDGTANKGGGIYLSGASNVTISDSDFMNNVAEIQGGGLYGAAFTSVIINEYSRFGNNRALSLGDDIYIANTVEAIEFNSFEIYNDYAATSIYVETANLTM
jgi:hypothetical protein